MVTMATAAAHRWQRARQQVSRRQALCSSRLGSLLPGALVDAIAAIVEGMERSERARQRWQLLRPAPIMRWYSYNMMVTRLFLLNRPAGFSARPVLSRTRSVIGMTP